MERLIDRVRQHPVLYDRRHRDYMRASLKDQIWAAIASELGYPDGTDVKEQWRKLRECHREALRRQYNKKRRGQGMYNTKMWLYQKQMEFLLPFMCQPHPGPDPIEDDLPQQLKTEDSSEDVASTSEAGLQEAERHQRRKRKARSEEQEADLSKDIFEQEVRGQMLETAVGGDSLYQFFACMFNTVRSMPLSSQLRVKKRIFDVVLEAEEELAESLEMGMHSIL